MSDPRKGFRQAADHILWKVRLLVYKAHGILDVEGV